MKRLPYSRLILQTNILRFFNFSLFCGLNVCGYSRGSATAHAQNHVCAENLILRELIFAIVTASLQTRKI